MNQTPWNKRKETKQEIIALLDISISTFNRIIYTKIGDSQDISYTNMLKLARFFAMKPEDLVNNILMDEFEILPILKTAVSVDDNLIESKNLNLKPVFPNPVTNDAQIQFFTAGGEISLKLYSLDGKELRKIVQGKFPTGNQFVTFNKNRLKNGQYLLVLQNGTERISQKIAIQ
ncbi:MAG: T9SS type A sorting domain-containing protein [Bacteroidetes bacterium]|nr:T9SS type A sorting domain-containing protein [Bacteroidota bacterium]